MTNSTAEPASSSNEHLTVLSQPWGTRKETGLKRAMVWCQPAGSPSWQDSGMERVLGIGGYFLRAADPAARSAWYRDCLDVAEETQEMEGVGRFGWVSDPEGNRVELWQPA
jgi:hypothetical protein